MYFDNLNDTLMHCEYQTHDYYWSKKPYSELLKNGLYRCLTNAESGIKKYYLTTSKNFLQVQFSYNSSNYFLQECYYLVNNYLAFTDNNYFYYYSVDFECYILTQEPFNIAPRPRYVNSSSAVENAWLYLGTSDYFATNLKSYYGNEIITLSVEFNDCLQNEDDKLYGVYSSATNAKKIIVGVKKFTIARNINFTSDLDSFNEKIYLQSVNNSIVINVMYSKYLYFEPFLNKYIIGEYNSPLGWWEGSKPSLTEVVEFKFTHLPNYTSELQPSYFIKFDDYTSSNEEVFCLVAEVPVLCN
ncbi:hypothetical protein AAEX28_07070 [Lentisphaerota bacterium WC36G]|nr:hypothetical protein LJT99_09935 [Lentisphaerae bacterium WC36]